VTDRTPVVYAREPDLALAEFRRVLVEAGMSKIRPIGDDARLGTMLAAASLILTARLDTPGQPLVGLARCVTDFAWCCYVSELAVCASAQRLGVGGGLLEGVRRAVGPGVTVLLVSVPDAVGFYEQAGMDRAQDAFWLRRQH